MGSSCPHQRKEEKAKLPLIWCNDAMMVGPKYLSFRPIFQGLSTFSLYWASTSTSFLSSVILGIKSLPFPGPCFRTNPFWVVQKFWLRWDSPTERYPRRCISQEDPTPWAHEWQIISWHCLDVLWRHVGPCYIFPEYNRRKLCSRPSESVMQTVFGRP